MDLFPNIRQFKFRQSKRRQWLSPTAISRRSSASLVRNYSRRRMYPHDGQPLSPQRITVLTNNNVAS